MPRFGLSSIELPISITTFFANESVKRSYLIGLCVVVAVTALVSLNFILTNQMQNRTTASGTLGQSEEKSATPSAIPIVGEILEGISTTSASIK